MPILQHRGFIPGRVGRLLTSPGGNGSLPRRPGVTRSGRLRHVGGSSRNRLSPGPRHEVSGPSSEAPRTIGFTRPQSQARQRGDLPLRTVPFRGPSRRRDESSLPRANGPLRVRDHTALTERRVTAAVRCDLPRGQPGKTERSERSGNGYHDFTSRGPLSESETRSTPRR